jgi:hypothetical protein
MTAGKQFREWRDRHRAMRTSYEIGDPCWIRIPTDPGQLYSGVVIGTMRVRSLTALQYLIQLDNRTWPNLEIRCAWTMGDHAGAAVPNLYTGVPTPTHSIEAETDDE